MSAPRTSGAPADDRTTRTRRSVLTGGVAGALGATAVAAPAARAQLPIDDRYVLRDRMPVNVKDKGATGNGTTNDTAAVQSAIDTVAANGGGTVFFPPGDYVVNGGLTIPPDKGIRLVGSGMTLKGNGVAWQPTRLVRKSGTTTIISAIGTSTTNRVLFELCDMEIRGSGLAGMLVDVQVGATVQFHNVVFAGASATGLRMRNVFNASGSHLRWIACGAGTAAPACLFDGVSGSQGGSDTVQWDDLQFEGNSGTDLKLTGNSSNDAGTVTTEIQMSQVKMEGGSASAANCPYIHLNYSQNCKFSDVHIGVHGGRTVSPLLKDHPFGGTRADKFVNLSIDNTGGDSFPYGIEHIRGGLQLDNVTILGAGTAAIKVDSAVAAGQFQLGNLMTSGGRAVIDSRTTTPQVASSGTITPPRERFVTVTGGTTVTSITPHEVGYVMTLGFAGAVTVTDGGNLRLAGSFAATADDTLTLACDGTNWHEVARSAN